MSLATIIQAGIKHHLSLLSDSMDGDELESWGRRLHDALVCPLPLLRRSGLIVQKAESRTLGFHYDGLQEELVAVQAALRDRASFSWVEWCRFELPVLAAALQDMEDARIKAAEAAARQEEDARREEEKRAQEERDKAAAERELAEREEQQRKAEDEAREAEKVRAAAEADRTRAQDEVRDEAAAAGRLFRYATPPNGWIRRPLSTGTHEVCC